MNKLLTDPIFRVDTSEVPERLSLPAVLTALGEDRLDSFPGLQRHQEDAFHIFLCYLAGAVLARAGRDDPGQDESFWREGLLGLAEGNENAWNIVVNDPTQPAFMQAPLPNRSDFAAFKPKAETPDELDLLQVAKNHDVKMQRASAFEAETWVYSLISLQTMTGMMGRGNYNISRINSGTGSRLRVGAIYDGRLGAQWLRDVQRLLAYRPDVLAGGWGYREDGTVLTWLTPWNLDSSLPLSRLDPFFIEIARAVRIVSTGSRLRALGAGSTGVRIAAKDLKGVLGDPWTPVVEDTKELKAWTVMSSFSPKDLRDLVFGDERLLIPFMQRPDPDRISQSHILKLSVLAPGGMGKTNGYHEAHIRIPGKAAGFLFKPGPERDHLASRSKESLARAGEIQNRVLKTALYSLLEAGPEKINFEKREVTAWVNQTTERYTEAWAKDFFPWLWRGLDQGDEASRQAWLEHLSNLAWTVLQDAMDRLPIRTGRGYRSRVRAEGSFYGCLYHHFPSLKKETAHDDRDNFGL